MKAGVTKTFLLIALPAALVAVVLLFVGMELHRFLTTSSRFAVKKIEIVSKGSADNEELVRLAGIPPGSNLFALELEEIRSRIERDPWVHSASVIRVLPNKIQVTYESQKPEAILGADSMYYLNAEGKPFYRIRSGDSLSYPLVQLEGRPKEDEQLRLRVAGSVEVLREFKGSSVFHEKDFGDLTVLPGDADGGTPYLMNLRYPPKKLASKKDKTTRLYTVSIGDGDFGQQVKRWEAVVRYLVQAGKKPRLIRLELGKKVVVKLEK